MTLKQDDKKNKIGALISSLCDKSIQKKQRKGNLLDVLIATVLSQNTNDVLSLKAFKSLKTSLPTWESVYSAPANKIEKLILIAGLSNQKTKTIKNILDHVYKVNSNLNLRHLVKKSDEEVFTELLAIKGVGKKTVACLLLFGMDRDVFPIDTHIHRISNRVGLVKTRDADSTFEEMKSLVPSGKAYSLHVGMIKFGREICTSRNPLCYKCPLIDYCDYEEKNWDYRRSDEIKKKNVFILNKI